ncbi:M4 family metallopeptidase [Dyadobacter jiangsuensis]|uniref:Neutral metalloproteinase n=1 Tax=Dyadobacter jiangsuensis TaxID=1591085 RepID=A0A2P8G0I0_9BACT|nr:M4 family metallopeptidase [Dyadobacter jiangsuensis]PSL27464.1 bacillolysin/neutral peptidase B [Dyadobacter jiangsuensis]
MDSNFKNGLQSFVFHETEGSKEITNEMNSSLKSASARMVGGGRPKVEDVARIYLNKARTSENGILKDFIIRDPEASTLDFRPIQVEDIPFTGNKTVKFRQAINNVSVYGSAVNVEVDKNLKLVSINSSVIPELEISTVAKISAEEALRNASEYIQNAIPKTIIPLLYIYFFEGAWRLVYIVKNVISKREQSREHDDNTVHRPHRHALVNYVNVIIDANDGQVLKLAPRVMSLSSDALGDDGIKYRINYRQNNGNAELVDEENNVFTYDLNYDTYSSHGALPGTIIIEQSQTGWLSAGVSAHYNACLVAAFLRNVLRRNGIDNKGMTLVSTVRCIEQSGIQEWNNAAWLPGIDQMVYGQVHRGGTLKSLAVSLDVVAHEILHGVTEYSSGLEYEYQSGALNESYSDIFGIIISNYGKELDQWNWQLGEQTEGVPFRDLSKPTEYGQPDHMNDYFDVDYDYGGVHYNSGIHNKAAFNLITSPDDSGGHLFNADEVAALFYMGLVQLSNSSGFEDSRRSVINAANSLFKNDSSRAAKLAAVANAFSAVGIG